MRTLFLLLGLAALPTVGEELSRKAPEFTILMADGKDIKLSSFRGKVVALEFLLTTCEHCQRCSQTLNRLQRELGAQGFQAAGAAVNENAQMLVQDYARQFNLDFPVGYSTREPVVEFLQHPIMTPMSFPTLVIVDREGIIRHRYYGRDPFFANEEKNLRDAVMPLLKAEKSKAKKK